MNKDSQDPKHQEALSISIWKYKNVIIDNNLLYL